MLFTEFIIPNAFSWFEIIITKIDYPLNEIYIIITKYVSYLFRIENIQCQNLRLVYCILILSNKLK
jgi:hypothetical protein